MARRSRKELPGQEIRCAAITKQIHPCQSRHCPWTGSRGEGQSSAVVPACSSSFSDGRVFSEPPIPTTRPRIAPPRMQRGQPHQPRWLCSCIDTPPPIPAASQMRTRIFLPSDILSSSMSLSYTRLRTSCGNWLHCHSAFEYEGWPESIWESFCRARSLPSRGDGCPS